MADERYTEMAWADIRLNRSVRPEVRFSEGLTFEFQRFFAPTPKQIEDLRVAADDVEAFNAPNRGRILAASLRQMASEWGT